MGQRRNAFAMSSNEDPNLPRLLCRKHDGSKGALFTEWKQLWLDAAEGKGDEDASWAETAQGNDPQAGLTLDGRYRDAASRYSEIQSVSRLFLDTEKYRSIWKCSLEV